MITALITLNLRVVRGGVGNVATITKSIQLPNVYESDEGIATSLVLFEDQTISPELRIESVDGEVGTVHLNMTNPFGVNLDKFIDGTTFEELAEKMKVVGWEVEPDIDGLRSLDEHNNIMEERDAQKSVPDEMLSDSAYSKKYDLKTTTKQKVVFLLIFVVALSLFMALVTSIYNVIGLEVNSIYRNLMSVFFGCTFSLIGSRLMTSWLVKNHRKQAVSHPA